MNLVIFSLGEKEYGVDIRQVYRVIRMRKPVSVPEAADFVEGVISLRGKVVPLVSLRKKMGIADDGVKRPSRIIITETDGHPIGVVVDSVTDVVSVESLSVTPPDQILKDAKYLIGVVQLGNRIVLMADLKKILSPEEMAGVGAVRGRVQLKKKNTESANG